MGDVIREDVVSILFEVEDSPFAKIRRMMGALMGDAQRFAALGQGGLAALGGAGRAALPPLQGISSSLNAAAAALAGPLAQNLAPGLGAALAEAQKLRDALAAPLPAVGGGLPAFLEDLNALPVGAAATGVFGALAQGLLGLCAPAQRATAAIAGLEVRGKSAAAGLAAPLEAAKQSLAKLQTTALARPAAGGFLLPAPKADVAAAAAAARQTLAAYTGALRAAAGQGFTLPGLDGAKWQAELQKLNPALQSFGASARVAGAGAMALQTGLGGANASLGALVAGAAGAQAGFASLALSMGQNTPLMALCLTNLGLKMAEARLAMQTGAAAITLDMQNMATAIPLALAPLAGSLYGVGVNAMLGFQNGLNSQRGALLALASGMANEVASTMARALKIHSPSRVTQSLGAFTGLGFAKGIRASLPLVQSGAQGLKTAATAPLLSPRAPAQNPPPQWGAAGFGRPVIQNNSPQFTLTIGGNASAADRDLERQVKGWILDSFTRLMAGARRGGAGAREV